MEIIGSSAPGTLIALVNKKEIFVILFEIGAQSPTTIRLGLRFPLFDSAETFSLSSVVCEQNWVFALTKDTGHIRILLVTKIFTS